MSILFLVLVVVLIIWGIALFARYGPSPQPWADGASGFLAWVVGVILTLLVKGVHF